ncbi:ECF transporter S component [Fictibacillus sp. Mic-4]|uniref:ECF transporter S component n=1 Tax=Fictibacillus TaxID=1329200 RepID=UPI00040DA4C9|nr:ECF transporter S component [Fictibacillus gelatini]
MHKGKVYRMIAVSMLSGIAYVLMAFDFPLPGFPKYLQIDFSEVPALLAAVLFGPGSGIVVEAIKNLLHYCLQNSLTGVPIDQMANFIAGTAFIVPASFLFKKNRTTKSLSMGLVTGTILMTLLMGILNYAVILPAYTWFLHAPQMSSQAMLNLVLVGIAPFNIIKGLLITILFVLLYTRLRPMLKRYSY